MAVTYDQSFFDYYTWFFSPISTINDGFSHSGGNISNFDYFSDDPSVGDTFQFNAGEPISGVKLEVGTPMNGNPVFVWEYLIGSTWHPLFVENADAITKSGTQVVRWTHPHNYRGRTTNARPGYMYRMRITDVTDVTEGGANSTTKVTRLQNSFNLTGTVTMDTVYNYDLVTPYVLITATTPQASMTPLECTFMRSGIAGKIDVILNNCTVGVGDTVVLTGIDYDGDALVEVIDVSSGGTDTYTTSGLFKNITEVACNGFGDGTIQVQTKRLGLIERAGLATGYVYNIYALVIFGDDSAVTTVTSFGETWNFIFVASRFVAFGSNVTMTFGYLDDTGDVSHSYHHVNVNISDPGLSFIPNFRFNYNGTINGYGLNLRCTRTAPNTAFNFFPGVWNVRQGTFDFNCPWAWAGDWTNLDGFYGRGIGTGIRPNFIGQPENIVVNNVISMFNNRSDFTFRNSLFEGFISFNNPFEPNRKIEFIDCPSLTPTDFFIVNTNNQPGDGVYLIKTLFLTVLDSVGNPIEGATVTLDDNNGNHVATVNTDSDGSIPEQELIWYKGNWITGFAEMDWVLHSPHNIKVIKQGYQTKVVSLNMFKRRDEVIVLEKQVDAVLARGQLAINADPSNSQSDVFI